MMASTWVGFIPPSHPRFRDLFSLVIMYLVSLPFSLSFFTSWLVCLPLLSLLLQEIWLTLSYGGLGSSGLWWWSPFSFWWWSSSSWAQPQLFFAMSLLWQAKSCQQTLKTIRQASYCTSSCDSVSYPLSWDLDFNWVRWASLLREYQALL